MKPGIVTEEQFLEDVSQHKMEVLLDSGVHRHLRFSRGGSSTYLFELVTWPGYLAFVGDMGSFTFWRTQDMFTFFGGRYPDGHFSRSLDYWAQKVTATDRDGGHRQFSEAAFIEVVNGYRLEWVREAAREKLLTKEERRELWEAVDEEVLSRVEDGEQLAHAAAHEFSMAIGGRTYELTDFWDHHFGEPSLRFQWACFAIQWGIQLYNDAKSAAVPADQQ
jgi:hypothetical protein